MRIADLLGCLELSHVASIIDHTLDVLVVIAFRTANTSLHCLFVQTFMDRV